jgi:FAD-linked sulfhydryl oxidase
MPRAPPPGFIVISAIALFVWFMFWVGQREHAATARLTPGVAPLPKWMNRQGNKQPIPTVAPKTQAGDAIMGHLGNETLKEELGRAAWKVLHTTMARFPDEPTTDESDALKSYMYLFARLYPCGECAEHFQKLLKEYPPQTSSRSAAAAWACFIHNQVNESKKKPIFDCSKIGDFYDCGCEDDEKDKIAFAGAKSEAVAKMEIDIEKEGPTQGG